MFNFLASKHRQPPEYNPNDEEEEEVQLKSARYAAAFSGSEGTVMLWGRRAARARSQAVSFEVAVSRRGAEHRHVQRRLHQ